MSSELIYPSFNLGIMKMGYFIVYKGNNSIFSRKIMQAQIDEGISLYDAEYTHIECCIGGMYSIAALFGHRISAIDYVKKNKGRFVKLVRVRVEDYERRRFKVAVWAATRCNLPYGYLGVLWFKIKKIFGGKVNFFSAIGDFCSELCAWAIMREYIDTGLKDQAMNLRQNILPRAPGFMMPGHFLDTKYFEIVWEGVIE